jgi:predicted nucleotidyltransferase
LSSAASPACRGELGELDVIDAGHPLKLLDCSDGDRGVRPTASVDDLVLFMTALARKSMAAATPPEQIDAMVRRIVERFDPEKIILFGSYARGTAGRDSDVDLLVVMAFRGSKREQQIAIRRALHDFRVPKDIIVTTPDDFAWRKDIPGTIERPAALEGTVLYARP